MNERGQYGSSGKDKIAAFIVLGVALAVTIPATKHTIKSLRHSKGTTR